MSNWACWQSSVDVEKNYWPRGARLSTSVMCWENVCGLFFLITMSTNKEKIWWYFKNISTKSMGILQHLIFIFILIMSNMQILSWFWGADIEFLSLSMNWIKQINAAILSKMNVPKIIFSSLMRKNVKFPWFRKDKLIFCSYKNFYCSYSLFVLHSKNQNRKQLLFQILVFKTYVYSLCI